MSEFLMIVPTDFTEIENAAGFFQNHMDESNVLRNVADGSLWEIAGALENFGALPYGMAVIDVRIFSGRLWVKFAPES